MMDVLDSAIAAVPEGAWAVGVSGGADSVALLALLRRRGDLRLRVVHLNHQSRGSESDEDAKFVAELCARWNVACTIATREEVEGRVKDAQKNVSARYRRLRFALFKEVCEREGLAGVVLAHHARDQAETVMLRLLRGSGAAGLTGMKREGAVGGVRVVRPLLGIWPVMLREFLEREGIAWREDSSNASEAYRRNIVRGAMTQELARQLIEMGEAMGRLTEWVKSNAPVLAQVFETRVLAELPNVLAIESARRWLVERGVAVDEVSEVVAARLVEMARDAATAGRGEFPGKIMVVRRRGEISVAEEE